MKIEIKREWRDYIAEYRWYGYKDRRYISGTSFLSEKEALAWKQKVEEHYESEESHNDEIMTDSKQELADDKGNIPIYNEEGYTNE